MSHVSEASLYNFCLPARHNSDSESEEEADSCSGQACRNEPERGFVSPEPGRVLDQPGGGEALRDEGGGRAGGQGGQGPGGDHLLQYRAKLLLDSLHDQSFSLGTLWGLCLLRFHKNTFKG